MAVLTQCLGAKVPLQPPGSRMLDTVNFSIKQRQLKYVITYICIRACAQRTRLGDIPRVHRPFFFLSCHVVSQRPRWPSRLNRLASEPKGSTCLWFPSTGLKVGHLNKRGGGWESNSGHACKASALQTYWLDFLDSQILFWLYRTMLELPKKDQR